MEWRSAQGAGRVGTRAVERAIDPMADWERERRVRLQGDWRRLRIAWFIAVGLFTLLVLLRLPVLAVPAEPEAPDERAFPVQLAPVVQPPTPAPLRIPERKARRVSVPTPLDFPLDVRPRPLAPPTWDGSSVEVETSGDLFGIPLPRQQPVGDEPLRVGGEVSPPVKIFAPPPEWTELARRGLRRSVVVILEATIDREGFVRGVEIVKGAPLGLDDAAVEAVLQWRFEPATLHGRPVAVRYHLSIRYEVN